MCIYRDAKSRNALISEWDLFVFGERISRYVRMCNMCMDRGMYGCVCVSAEVSVFEAVNG